MYEEIIKQLSVFEEDFNSKSFGWNAGIFNANKIDQLDLLWNDEQRVKKIKELQFYYGLFGLKQAGIENYNEHLVLKFEMLDTWYCFSLVNDNEQQPFLKKLYHQRIDEKDIETIIDVMMNRLMDSMEPYLEKMS